MNKSNCRRADDVCMSTPENERDASASSRLSPIFSEYASDGDMRDLIEHFLNGLQAGMNAIQRAHEDDDRGQLLRLAHQLKGAANGYGFPSITNSAADLESSLYAHEAEMSCLSEKVEALIDLCRRATAGAKGS